MTAGSYPRDPKGAVRAIDQALVFGRWRLLPAARRLLCDGSEVKLPGRAFDLLLALAGAQGAEISKEALLRRIWPGTHVEENSLHVAMSALRKALGEDAAALIATVPGRGYRFTATVDAAESPTPVAAARPRLAVLPFANMTGDPAQEHLADGVTEELTTALSHLGWFDVIARNSAFVFKDRAADLREVGRSLGVGYVLEGSLRQAGGRLRLTAQLCEAETARHLWADRFDAAAGDLFEAMDALTDRVVGAMEPPLRAAEIARAQARPTGSLGAYDLYLRALPHCRDLSDAGTREALSLLRRAIALDSGFLAARAALAGVHAIRFFQRWSGTDDTAEAVNAARAVIAASAADVDPSSLAWAGYVLAYLGHDFAAAAAAGDRALARAPNSATVLFYAAFTALYAGDAEAAISRIDRARSLSPTDPMMYHFHVVRGASHFIAGEYDEAAAWLRQALIDRPDFAPGHAMLAACLAQGGRLAEAEEVIASVRRTAPQACVTDTAARTAISGEAKARLLEGLRRAGLPE